MKKKIVSILAMLTVMLIGVAMFTFAGCEHTHVYDNGVIVKQATCEEDGLKRYSCKKCDETKEEVIKAFGHNYTVEVVKPTCT